MAGKTADTRVPILPLLAERWSPVAFSSKPVEPALLTKILEAARWAPSCFNDQPWFYLLATIEQPEEHARLVSCLVESNQQWARHAPVLMVGVARHTFQHNGSPNKWAEHDLGQATMSLVVEAHSQGLFVHQMGGIHFDKIRSEYQIPEGYDPIAGIAVGYHGDPSGLSQKLQDREAGKRHRKDLESFIFTGGWGKAATLPQP